MRRIIGDAVARWTSPGRASPAGPAESSKSRTTINGVPHTWIGKKAGDEFVCDEAYPCIAQACAAGGVRHPPGTLTQGLINTPGGSAWAAGVAMEAGLGSSGGPAQRATVVAQPTVVVAQPTA